MDPKENEGRADQVTGAADCSQSSWLEKISTFSIHPGSASARDVARMAAHIMDLRHELLRLSEVVCEQDNESIMRVLSVNETTRKRATVINTVEFYGDE